jgi:hypothetical protein
LSNVNGNPFMRRRFPGVNVNPWTWLVKLGSARVNPKSVAGAGFVLPINLKRFVHLSRILRRLPRTSADIIISVFMFKCGLFGLP